MGAASTFEGAALANNAGKFFRRNLFDSEIARLMAILDERRPRGGDHGNQHTGGKVAKTPDGGIAKSHSSATSTAQTLGVSPRKAERARTVLDHAEPEVKEQVLSGEKSINRAYEETRTLKKLWRIVGSITPPA